MKSELLTYITLQRITANCSPGSWMKSKLIPILKKQRRHPRMQQLQGNQVDESLRETMGANRRKSSERNSKYQR